MNHVDFYILQYTIRCTVQCTIVHAWFKKTVPSIKFNNYWYDLFMLYKTQIIANCILLYISSKVLYNIFLEWNYTNILSSKTFSEDPGGYFIVYNKMKLILAYTYHLSPILFIWKTVVYVKYFTTSYKLL